MIDLRDASLIDFVPDSIASDPEIVAISLAIDPELREVSAAIVGAIILPRINEQPMAVLDAVAWGFRLNELTVWNDAPLTGKRRLLAKIIAVMRRSGTVWSVRRIFDLLQLTGRLVEWFEEGGAAYTYRLIVDASEAGVTLYSLKQVPELTRRFAPKRCQLSQLAVEANRSAPLVLYPALQTGRLVTISFGGP